jgi:hypothetical protein
MEYGSTPYVGMAREKNGGPIPFFTFSPWFYTSIGVYS